MLEIFNNWLFFLVFLLDTDMCPVGKRCACQYHECLLHKLFRRGCLEVFDSVNKLL